jgi:hypothetical protein
VELICLTFVIGGICSYRVMGIDKNSWEGPSRLLRRLDGRLSGYTAMLCHPHMPHCVRRSASPAGLSELLAELLPIASRSYVIFQPRILFRITIPVFTHLPPRSCIFEARKDSPLLHVGASMTRRLRGEFEIIIGRFWGGGPGSTGGSGRGVGESKSPVY